MQVKIDTKEKFHVITLLDSFLTANMTADLHDSLCSFLQKDVKNIILKMTQVQEISLEAAEMLVKVQQLYYENNASCVICEITPSLETYLDKEQLLEILNVVPTESEAWDIVQMEEIERELMDGDGLDF